MRKLKLFNACDVKLVRNYSTKIDLDLLVSRILCSTATLNLYLNKIDTNFNDDLNTLINVLNDNDMVSSDGIVNFNNKRYFDLKEKRKMALKSILSRPSQK